MLAYVVTVPKNTSDSNRTKQELNMIAGHLHTIQVRFRSGCNHYVIARLYKSLKQIVPLVEGQYLKGNDEIFTIPVDYDFTNQAETIRFEGSSPGSLYPHNIYLYFYFEKIIPTPKRTVNDIFSSMFPIGKRVR